MSYRDLLGLPIFLRPLTGSIESIRIGIGAAFVDAVFRAIFLSRIPDQGTDNSHGSFSLRASELQRMPRYYFDAWNSDRIAQDNEGVECADDQSACGAAGKALVDLAREIV